MRKPGFSRREALVGAAAMMAMCTRALGQTPEKLHVGIIPDYGVAPVFAAISRGYFRDVGLDVDTSPSAGGAASIPALIGGSVDIAYGNVVSTLLAAQQGLDLKVIAPGTNGSGLANTKAPVVAVGDSGIKSGKDLEGKSLGVNTRNNIIWLYARAWIKATGGNPDLVNFREVPFPQMEDAVRQHRIDAAFMIPPFSTSALSTPGLMEIGFPYSEVQPGVNVGHFVTTGKFYAEKRETVDKFVTALRRGVVWYNENRLSDEGLGVVSSFTKMGLPLLKKIGDVGELPLHSDLPQLQQTMELMIENKLLSAPLDLKSIFAPIAF